MINDLVLPALIILGASSASIYKPLVIPDRPLDRTGSCHGDKEKFDLSNIIFIENQAITLESAVSKFEFSIDGESIKVSQHGQDYVKVVDIGYEVEPKKDIDIELKFAFLDHNFVLYWKETYQHRIYRQGLFQLTGGNIQFLCKGEGGILKSH